MIYTVVLYVEIGLHFQWSIFCTPSFKCNRMLCTRYCTHMNTNNLDRGIFTITWLCGNISCCKIMTNKHLLVEEFSSIVYIGQYIGTLIRLFQVIPSLEVLTAHSWFCQGIRNLMTVSLLAMKMKKTPDQQCSYYRGLWRGPDHSQFLTRLARHDCFPSKTQGKSPGYFTLTRGLISPLSASREEEEKACLKHHPPMLLEFSCHPSALEEQVLHSGFSFYASIWLPPVQDWVIV